MQRLNKKPELKCPAEAGRYNLKTIRNPESKSDYHHYFNSESTENPKNEFDTSLIQSSLSSVLENSEFVSPKLTMSRCLAPPPPPPPPPPPKLPLLLRPKSVNHFLPALIEIPIRFRNRFWMNQNPIRREISIIDKNSLSYYYKNNSYNYNVYINRIRQSFSSDSRKEVLLKSINTIQFLLNRDEFIYPRVIDAIKNELYFSCLFDEFPLPSKNEISNFVDQVVQLSRNQPSFFSTPERTRSIKKLFQYLNLNLQNRSVFSGMEIVNNTFHLSDIVNLNHVELVHRIPTQRRNTFYFNSLYIQISPLEISDSEVNIHEENELIRQESPSLDQSILFQLGSNYDPINDYPKPKVTLDEKSKLQAEVQMASMSYMEVLNILKNHWDAVKNPGEIEIDFRDEKENVYGIKKLKIELIDIITRDNILLNGDENEQFMFIVRERDGTLFLNPYTPDSFLGSLEAKGLFEQTTRLPIVLQCDKEVKAKRFSEDYWSIISKDSFTKLFSA